jgi:hypothetical protein
LDRRTVIKRGLGAGAALLGLLPRTAGAAARHGTPAEHHRHRRVAPAGGRSRAPNILTIIVDQLRAPVWMPPAFGAAAAMPNLAALSAR